MDKYLEEKLQLHKQWNDMLRSLLDGKEYKMSERKPLWEYECSHRSLGCSNDVIESYVEEDSYCIELYPHGDKSQKKIVRIHSWGSWANDDHFSYSLPGSSESFDINDDDTWKYSEEAFEAGFASADSDAHCYIEWYSL